MKYPTPDILVRACKLMLNTQVYRVCVCVDVCARACLRASVCVCVCVNVPRVRARVLVYFWYTSAPSQSLPLLSPLLAWISRAVQVTLSYIHISVQSQKEKKICL